MAYCINETISARALQGVCVSVQYRCTFTHSLLTRIGPITFFLKKDVSFNSYMCRDDLRCYVR